MSSVYEWSETESQSDDESVVVERKIPVLSITRRILINLAIPFINGIMLGFGEIFAHEIGVAYGWRQSRVSIKGPTFYFSFKVTCRGAVPPGAFCEQYIN